jgi:TatA/E family protein of Tat protein translocase
MLGGHWLELMVVLLIAVFVFGAKRLPEMGSAVGKTIREFQKSMREVDDHPNNTPAVTPAERPPLANGQATPPATLTAPSATQTTADTTHE